MTRRVSERARHAATGGVLSATALLLYASVLHAQPAGQVAGTVFRPDSATIATGTLVEVQSGSREAQRVLTDSRGRFRAVVAYGDSIRVRALRPGMRPSVAPVFVLQPGETRDLTLVLVADPVPIATVSVRDSRVCGERAEAPAWRLWEQARTALQNASLTERDTALQMRQVEYQGETTPAGTTIVEDSLIRAIGTHEQHPATYYDALFRDGFIWTTTTSATYHGPDARFLSDDRFASTHCFRLAERGTEFPGAIGVRFEPIRRPRHTGIQGVFWIDSATSLPVHLEFTYVNAPRGHTAEGTGGYASFAQLETGHWMLSDWMVRMAD